MVGFDRVVGVLLREVAGGECWLVERAGEEPAGGCQVTLLGHQDLGEQLFDVAVGQVVMQVPAHCYEDHVMGKRNPAKPDTVAVLRKGGDASAQPARARHPAMQQTQTFVSSPPAPPPEINSLNEAKCEQNRVNFSSVVHSRVGVN